MGILNRFFGSGEKQPDKRKPERIVPADAERLPAPPETVLIAGMGNVRFEEPVEAPNWVDVKAFLSQNPLPYLWPKDEKYRQSVDKNQDPQRLLRDQWTGVFLGHPNPEVVLGILTLFDLQGGTSSALVFAGLLARGEPKLAREAARVVWTGNDRMLELTITALGSCGETPSGIDPDDGKRGAEFLRDSCPASRKATFQKLALEAFGPASAGMPGQFSQAVTFKEGGLKKGATGQLEKVEFYAAANKLDALRFLESCKISREPLQFPKQNVVVGAERMTTRELQRFTSSMPKVTYEGVHRFIVETPEGTWGKDNSGIYECKPA